MDPFKIDSSDEDSLYKYAADFEDTEFRVERKGGKGGHKGPKTSKEINSSQKENAEEKRKEKAEDKLKRELKHFPFEYHGKERIDEAVHDYSEWVLKSLKNREPYLSNLDEEFKYFQSKASGPGGQNVNKTSNAITVKHLMTGMFARSEDSRETLVNRRTAFSKLYENLTNHIKNWNTYLKGLPKDKRQDEIENFIKDMGSK
jgi:hypothetical protein